MDSRASCRLSSTAKGRRLDDATLATQDPSRRKELVEALGATRLFSGLPDETLQTIAESCTLVSFQPGDEMMQEGQPGDCAYVLLEGEAVVTRSGYGIVTRRSGECLGELALLDSQARCASVKAFGTVTAARLDRESFDRLLTRQDFVKNLLLCLTRKLRESVCTQLDDAVTREELREALERALPGALAAGVTPREE